MMLMRYLRAAPGCDSSSFPWICFDTDGTTPDLNTPLCTAPDDIASWAVPGSAGVSTCHPDPTAAELLTMPWVQDAKNGLAGQIRTLTTYFMNVPDPHVGNPNGTMTQVVAFLDGSLKYFAGFFMVIAFILSAIKIMHDRDRGKHVKDVLMMILLAIANQGATIAVIAIALIASSAFSTWILDQATTTGMAENLTTILTGDGGGMAGVATVLFLLFATACAFFLCLMLVARGAVLFVRTGMLLISGSFYSTDVGKQVWRECVGAIAAFILWKPTVAIIFATGFKLLSTDLASQDGGTNFLYGIALLFLAMFSLPALQRVVTPMVSPVASGQGAGAVAGAAVTTFAYGGMRAFGR